MRNQKKQNIIQLILMIGIIILANIISSFVFTRIDLTSDKRFTLSQSSKNLVRNLKDVVFIKVYLEGDFPAGFTKLRNATQELIDELRTYSKGNLEYEFIDPSADPDAQERNRLYHQLAEKGLQPTNLEEKSKEGSTQKIIFPGAIVSYSNQEIPVQLLKDQLGTAPAAMLNNSIQNLEYEITSAIHKVTNPYKPTIGFIEGHRELRARQVEDISNSLKNSYDIKRTRIDGKLGILDEYRAIIIAKPDSAFSEKDKFIIDQYIMRGGKVVWLIDQMDITMDSLSTRGETIALARSINLDDMLFRYGVRINYDLLLDIQSAPIPVVTGYIGNQPRQQLRPWFYFPLLTPYSHHVTVNNLNTIRAQFISSIDTITAPGINKTVLLNTSRYTRVLTAPVRVSLGIMQLKPDPKQYNQHDIPVAVLLEGNFQSLYKNRIPPAIAQDSVISFKDQSEKPSKMVVISDGDIIRNDFAQGRSLALGFDKYSGTTFGNKDFVQNIIDYLCDDSGIMTVRSKEFKLRMLDPAIVESKYTTLQLINCVVPVAAVMLFGVFKFYRRKRKYS